MSVTGLPKKQARPISAFGETGKHVTVLALNALKGCKTTVLSTRWHEPMLDGQFLQGDRLLLTDGGLETDLVYDHGIDLQRFAAFALLGNGDGQKLIADYLVRHRFHPGKRHLVRQTRLGGTARHLGC